MLKLNEIVKISIKRATSQVSVSDLNTVLILVRHTVSEGRAVTFSSVDEMIDYGFVSTDNAYLGAELIFSQNPKLDKIIVGNVFEGETYAEGMREVLGSDDQWLTVICESRVADEQLALARYIETTNKIYLTCYQPLFDAECNVLENKAVDEDDKTDIGALIADNNLERTWAFYKGDNSVFPEAGLIGTYAPAEAGTEIVLYKTVKGIVADTISTDMKLTLEEKNYTFYTTVHKKDLVMGASKVGFGEWVDIMYATCWLDARLSERIFGVLINSGKIPYTNKGLEKIAVEVRAVLAQAREIGILSDDTPFKVYVPDATSLSSAKRNSREVDGITFEAPLAGAIHKVHVNGTVYA